MRNAFAEEIFHLATIDPRIVLLSGDIGNRLFDPFKKSFPNRFYNCGIAEASMTGIAAGLAMRGLRPVTYTITPFNTTRCLEQIRVDICYHNLPVIIVGTGSGLSYASLGCTHHSCEDISLLRSLPNMTVICPGDVWELKTLLQEAIKLNRPVYLRIGKKGEPIFHKALPALTIGKGEILKKGLEIVIFTTGNMLSLAMEVAKDLENEHLYPEVINLHTVKPLDTQLLKQCSKTFSLFVSIEEHSLIGGLGSSLAEWIIDSHTKTALIRFGTKDIFPHKLGSQEYLREVFGLTKENISKQILTKYKELILCEQKLPF